MTENRPKWRLPPGPFPIWVFERDGGAILAANHAAVGVYGYSLEEFRSCSVADLSPDVGASDHLRLQTVSWTGLVRQRRKDGSTFEAELTTIETFGEEGTMVVLVQPGAESDERR